MYTEFYGLKEKPFNLTPSPRFLYLSEGHKEALALLNYGVMDRKGFILLTGEVGTGKTTMVRTLLDSLNHTVKYILLSNPLLSQKDFVNYLALSVFKKKIRQSRSWLSRMATRPASSARIILAISTSICPRRMASTSFSAISITSTPRKSRRTSITRKTRP